VLLLLVSLTGALKKQAAAQQPLCKQASQQGWSRIAVKGLV
jgi:hypothetical protein